MHSTTTRDEIVHKIKQLSSMSHRRYGNYAYSTGFYESLLADVLHTLPAAKQETILKQIQDTVKDLAKSTT